jgi:hypothetical protein
MTVVVASSSLLDGFIVADCQVTYTQPTGGMLRRDFCQKIFITDYGVVVGIAGSICLARFLVTGLIEELNARADDRQEWLKDGDVVMQFLLSGIREHLHRHPDHAPCRERATELLIAWMDYTRQRPDGTWVDGVPAPIMQVMKFWWHQERLWWKRKQRGTIALGRSESFAQDLHDEAYEELVTHFGRFSGMAPVIIDAQRALLGTEAIRRRLIETNRAAGVGGLYQVMTLGPSYGGQTVPYFYLETVEPGFRTYVAMRIDNGEWIQEHRPTNTIMRVKTPWEINLDRLPSREIRFDSSVRLDRNSLGVFPAQKLETVFSLYNPPEVPEAVRPSWGEAPLAPLTYEGRYRVFDNQPRWPGFEPNGA